MTSRAGGSSPHGAVMMRTLWPSSERRSYVSRMCAFAPPGRGYAYGETMPIFIKPAQSPACGRETRSGLVVSLVAGEPLLAQLVSSLRHPAAGAPDPVAHHRPPPLRRRPPPMLADRPPAAPRGGATRGRRPAPVVVRP